MPHVDAINKVETGNNDNDSSTSGDKPIDDVVLMSVSVN